MTTELWMPEAVRLAHVFVRSHVLSDPDTIAHRDRYLEKINAIRAELGAPPLAAPSPITPGVAAACEAVLSQFLATSGKGPVDQAAVDVLITELWAMVLADVGGAA